MSKKSKVRDDLAGWHDVIHKDGKEQREKHVEPNDDGYSELCDFIIKGPRMKREPTWTTLGVGLGNKGTPVLYLSPGDEDFVTIPITQEQFDEIKKKIPRITIF